MSDSFRYIFHCLSDFNLVKLLIGATNTNNADGLSYSNIKSQIPNREPSDSYLISVILSTEDPLNPVYQTVSRVRRLIPNDISNQIIVIHYNQSRTAEDLITATIKEDSNGKDKTVLPDESVTHASIRGEIGSAFVKGVRLSLGQFILVMDADYPYPDEVLAKMINELIESPNSILIASRYAGNNKIERVPFVRNTISKGARIIVKHGLKIKNVNDPLSRCFATSRRIFEHVMIETNGNEILLEVLVKGNKYNKENSVTIKEIPFKQSEEAFSKKLNHDRIVRYLKAVWYLYRYGQKTQSTANKPEVIDQKKRKSVLFLSKAGRFFTVGASGLAVNYVVSLILSSVIPNMWYIHATFFGILISITTNFLLNKVWTFEDRNFSLRHFIKQFALFLSLCSFGAAIQLGLVTAFVGYYHIQYSVSLITAVCIASIGNFLLNKKITFGEKIWE
jgi:dolichol-phosphate mannosyltransferase